MNTENTAEKKIMYAVKKGDEFIDDGYETLDDAVDEMMYQWRMLTVQERVRIARRDYRDITDVDYMVAVGYDAETGEHEEYIPLAEVIPLNK